ncbi:hypothetical protein [Amycolatopsis sp. CA-128772]|uniref:hypothetical protein n=1 Tax=Amycolatopsis sp. CA-128772 TaxID=2073159 RepID=UPI000CD231B8|nr:hypothetical protein [Amycolatopsis sp. CA-128772]
MTALAVVALVAILAVVAALVVATLVDDHWTPERPGTDEQWHDLADAMRRYRRRKSRGHRHV